MTTFIIRFLEPEQEGNTDMTNIFTLEDGSRWQGQMRSEPIEVADEHQGEYNADVLTYAASRAVVYQ